MFFRADVGFHRADKAGGAASIIAAGAVAQGSVDFSAGQVLLGDGTTSAPGLAFAAQTNTGIERSSGNMREVRAGASHLTHQSGNIAASQNLNPQSGFRLDAEAVQTGNYTATATDLVVFMNGVSLTLTLPATPGSGQLLLVKNRAATTLTVARNAKNIDDVAADTTVAAGKAKIFYYDGTGWYTFSIVA